MKKLIIAAFIGSLAVSAWATNNEHNNVHNKDTSVSMVNANVNQNTSAASANQHQHQTQSQTANGGAGGQGGQGGAGGKGGTAFGGAGGAGGSATGGNATNGSVSNSDANNASQQTNVTNVNPRQTASAANVTVMPTAVCSGVTGGGASSAVFGVSFGTSWTDANCMLLEQVRTTAVILEDQETASEMMCAIDAYRDARARLGKPCRTKLATNTGAPAAQVEYTDPIIRARLGLPPLN